MNALRTLPLLNRPSRSSSPAPPSTQASNSTAAGAITQPPGGMAPPLIDPHKARARSLSRQMTDKVSSLHLSSVPGNGAVITASQPLGASTKGHSPPHSRPSTPRTSLAPLPGAVPADTPGPQGGYMDVLGLRLNEIVNKACLGVDFKAKKGFRKGSGWQVGESVVHELPFPPSDAYLIRAVLRTAVRSLSIYFSRLESLLLPALTDPNFALPLHLTSPTPNTNPINSTQLFAISVAHTAWETCEVLEQTLETGKWPRFVQETLRPVMDKFDLIVGKVVQPLLGGLKRDLVASISRTEGTSPPGGKVVGLATIPAPANAGGAVPLTKEHSNQPGSRLTKEVSQGGTARQLAIPVCLQHLASRIDASRKVLEVIAAPCQDDGEGWITGVVVAVVWRGMCVMSEKDLSSPTKNGRPPSPTSVARALAGLGKDTAVAAPVGVAQKLVNPLSILPSRTQSRPPSPPRANHANGVRMDATTHAILSFEGLIKRLVNGLVQSPNAPPGSGTAAEPIDPNSTEHIAREALFEACEALTSLRTASAAMHGPQAHTRMLASLRRLRDDVDLDVDEELDDALEDLPAITLFTVLLRRANSLLVSSSPPLKIRVPAEIWGWTTAEYDRQVLSGFGAAEEWGRRVALALKGDVEKVLSGLSDAGEKGEVVDWVKALGVALDARAAVKVPGAI